MRLDRRIDASEAKPGADYAELVEWEGNKHFPTMTKGELKKMLEDMRDSGSGRLLVRPATMTTVAANVTVSG